jgi:hypothetical protein
LGAGGPGATHSALISTLRSQLWELGDYRSMQRAEARTRTAGRRTRRIRGCTAAGVGSGRLARCTGHVRGRTGAGALWPSGPLVLWPSRASRDRVAARGRASVPIVRDRGMPPCIGHWALTVGRCLAPHPRTNFSHRPTVRSSLSRTHPYVGLDAVSKPITTRLETADPALSCADPAFSSPPPPAPT